MTDYGRKKIAAVSKINLANLTEQSDIDPTAWYVQLGEDDGESGREELIKLDAKTLEDAITEITAEVHSLDEYDDVEFLNIFRISEMHSFRIDEYRSRSIAFQKQRDAKAAEEEERKQLKKLKKKFEKPDGGAIHWHEVPTKRGQEIWIYRDRWVEHELRRLTKMFIDGEENSAHWHGVRGRLTGVPVNEIDYSFHDRQHAHY